MNVVKDTPFEFGYQVWQIRPPQPSLMIVVKGTYQIVPNGVCTIADEQAPTSGEVYWDDDPNNSVRMETDFALRKRRGECFLHGTCHPPGGSATSSAVSFRVGSVRKSIAVVGDRHWQSGVLRGQSRPQPFTSMPLRWEKAFGGPGFAKNPVGAGIAPVETPSGNVVALPNLENPDALITDASQRPEPAAAFPVHGTWKHRAALMGTFDQRWLDLRWPWLPEDFNWDFFNAAPLDQRIEGYWQGDEEITGQNLHPEQTQFRTRLPGFRARAFLEIRGGNAVTFREVPLNLDTITLDTDGMRVLCQWRGLVEVPSEDLHEVETLFYVHEPAQAQKSLDECRAWLERKRSEEAAEEAAFEPEEPAADSAAGSPPPPPPPPPPNPLAEAIKTLQAQAASAAAAGTPEGAAQAQLLGGMASELGNVDAPEPPPPPQMQGSQVRAAMEAQGLEVPPAVAAIPDVPDEPEEPAAEAPPEPQPPSRQEIHERCQRGERFEGEDLSGVDLSGLDLSHADFSGAILTRANLSRCRLDGAKFDGATMPEVDLSESSLLGVSFKEAEMPAARGFNSVAEGAIFDDVSATESRWTGARFPRASLKAADFSRGVFERCDFQHAEAAAADFTLATMDDSDFRHAKLVDARFEGTMARRCQFDDADLTKLRASEGADLSESSLRGVVAQKSKWDHAVLNKVNFSLSDLTGADFAAARLVQANFTGCVLRLSRWQGASLVGAVLVKCDALESNFEAADLSHADMRGSNFFSAQFFRARVEFAQLELANVTRTHLAKPRKSR